WARAATAATTRRRRRSFEPEPSATATPGRRSRLLHRLLHRLSPSAPARCDGAPPAPTAASELEGKVTHLMELLKAHQSRDAEASRLQQALQCQEEADAAKLVELMRRQEAASAAAVEEAKAAIEAQLVERFREEQAAAAEAHSAQLQQLSAEHSTQLQQAAALLEAQAREKFETAVAHERAYLSALKQLELDVDVLTRVLAPTVYLMQSFPTSLCLPLRARRLPPRAPARHPFCAATP
ncbi:hypothetical protein EMIHUDRAFT_374032, partial [Emiliania huxleyi CCMP1516]